MAAVLRWDLPTGRFVERKILETDSRLPRYQRLRDELARQIAERRWRHGKAIPTEQALAHAYGVAVGTVRKAVDQLVAEGLLERFQGRGTFVRRPSFNGSLFRFFRFQTVEGERRVPTSCILERVVEPAPAVVAAKFSLAPLEQVIRLLRLRVVDGTPMLVEDIWLPYAPFAAFAALDLAEIGDLLYPVYEARCNQVIATASETLTVEPVDAAHATRLGIAPGTPVIVIERLAYGTRRQPLEWRRSRGPASEFHYQVEIH